MSIFLLNAIWMIYNLYLAILPVVFCWFLFRMPHRIYFAIVLGKIERVNSWDVFLNPQLVVTSVESLFRSYELLVLAILFGLFANFFYFLFRERAKKLYSQWATS